MGEPEAKREVPPGASPRSGKPPPEHTRWKKGQSGNPGGRPRGLSVTAALRELLNSEHNGRVLTRVVAERWLKDALSGKPAHLQMLLDRTEGAVGQSMRFEARGSEVSGGMFMQTVVLAVPPEYREGVIRKVRELIHKEMEAGGPVPPDGGPDGAA